MTNRTYATEWVIFAKRNLDTAILPYHTDIIGIEIQQTLEKLLKSLFAYKNIKRARCAINEQVSFYMAAY